MHTEVSELTLVERAKLENYETVIDSGLKTFVQVGDALAGIRDGRLYRLTHHTFEDYCQGKWQLKRAHAYRLIEASSVVKNVESQMSPIGDKSLPTHESQARELSRVPAEEQAAVWEEVTAEDPNPTAAKVREVVESRNPTGDRQGANTGEVEWYTPPEYLEAARKVMGSIDVDPASCEAAQENVKAELWFDATEDGLEYEWPGNVWLNPPYAKGLVDAFVGRLVMSAEVDQAVLLVNNATDTAWFHSALQWCDVVCFPRGRIHFIDKAGSTQGSPNHGQAFFYMGENVDDFVSVFSEFGACLEVLK